MDFRHLIVTCLFSMLRLSFEAQKIKENYAILNYKSVELLQRISLVQFGEQADTVRWQSSRRLLS